MYTYTELCKKPLPHSVQLEIQKKELTQMQSYIVYNILYMTASVYRTRINDPRVLMFVALR
jgi:hypothetical protein